MCDASGPVLDHCISEIIAKSPAMGEKLTKALLGLEPNEPPEWMDMRLGIYYEFAFFLSDALHVLKPPPLKVEGGLLGALLAKP